MSDRQGVPLLQRGRSVQLAAVSLCLWCVTAVQQNIVIVATGKTSESRFDSQLVSPLCVHFRMSYPPPLNRQQIGIPQLPPRIPPPQYGGFAPTVPPGNLLKRNFNVIRSNTLYPWRLSENDQTYKRTSADLQTPTLFPVPAMDDGNMERKWV